MPRILKLLRSVVWSFFGVRRRADSARDLEGASPATLVVTGLVVAAALVIGIVSLAHWIVRPTLAPVNRPTEPGAAVATAPVSRARDSQPFSDTMEERMRACAVCHGSATQSAGNVFSPRIAGKPAGYLFGQLQGFRDGRRSYGPMVYLVQYMSDAYLREIAEYFAGLDLPYPPPEPSTLAPDLAARVRTIVEHGDPARDVPACVQCHGEQLAGVEPAIPGLLGLPRAYVGYQFGAWRNGEVRSPPPDCMAEIARRLAPDDIPAIAAWLASQPVPAGSKAEPADAGRRLPMECGSVSRAAAR